MFKKIFNIIPQIEIAKSRIELQQELFSVDLNLTYLSVYNIKLYVDKIIKLYRITINHIIEQKPPLTFENIVRPLIDVEIYTHKAYSVCVFSKHLHPNVTIQKTSEWAAKCLSESINRLKKNNELFNKLHSYQATKFLSEQIWHLTEEEKYYFNNLMNNYKRAGFGVNGRSKKLNLLDGKIKNLSVQFNEHINDLNIIQLGAHQLAGLPSQWFRSAQFIVTDINEFGANKKEKSYLVPVSQTEVLPLLHYVKNPATRKRVFESLRSIGGEKNIQTLKKLVRVRNNRAKLLGYPSHFAYTAESHINQSVSSIKSYLNEMNNLLSISVARNFEELTAFAREKEKNDQVNLNHSDIYYYIRLREETLYPYDENTLSEYFQLEHVINYILLFFAELFNLSFEENKKDKNWHENVRCYEVRDLSENKLSPIIGKIYVDLHQKNSKLTVLPLVRGCDISHLGYATKRLQNVAAVFGDFSEKKLLSLNEIENFFGKLGQAVHYVCSHTQLMAHHASKTTVDFRGFLTNLFQRLLFQPSVLQSMSKHYLLHTHLSTPLIEKIILRKKLHLSYNKMREVALAIFDFTLHTLEAEELYRLNLRIFFRELEYQLLLLPIDYASYLPASFKALASGYDAAYYTYLTQYTYAADVYAHFFGLNPCSRVQGVRFRDWVLKPGASQPPMDLIKKILGRAPKTDAFMEECGLEPILSEEKVTTRSSLKFFSQQALPPTEVEKDNEQTVKNKTFSMRGERG